MTILAAERKNCLPSEGERPIIVSKETDRMALGKNQQELWSFG